MDEKVASRASSGKPDHTVGRNPLSDDFGKRVRDLMKQWHIPGMSISIIDGEDTWDKGYGFADLSSNAPVTASTLFYGASTTKAFTTAAMAQLIDAGTYKSPAFPDKSIDWKTPVKEVLGDDFVLLDEYASSHLTIEDALCHRSGMPSHDMSIARHYDGRRATVKDIVRSMRYLPPTAELRTVYQYCNMMFITISHVIETLTSRWLGDLLRDSIWKPLDMNETFFNLDDAVKAGAQVAKGYEWDPVTEAFNEVPYISTNELSGAGAILSNVLDYAKWLRCMIHEAKPLSQASHVAVKTPRIFVSASPEHNDAPRAYALGWRTTTYKGHRYWTHSGGLDSWGAEVIFFPGLKFGIALFANTAETSNAVGRILSWELIDDKIGVPIEERIDWDAREKENMDSSKSRAKHAVEILYPNRAQPPLSMSLPLESYAGTYYHPAYLNLKLEIADPSTTRRPNISLTAHRPDLTLASNYEFEHVSGEFWVMYTYFIHAPNTFDEFGPMHFKIGPDGKVAFMGIEWGSKPSGQGEGLIMFEKTA